MAEQKYNLKNVNRFWSRINREGSIPIQRPDLGACWEWMGGGNGQGYGQVRIASQQISAHQVAWELTRGEVPAGLRVLHQCGNRGCVNPAHLFLGNVPIKPRGEARQPYTTGTARHHLTHHEILSLKNRYAAGESMAELARAFDVAYNTVNNIVKGRTRRNKR